MCFLSWNLTRGTKFTILSKLKISLVPLFIKDVETTSLVNFIYITLSTECELMSVIVVFYVPTSQRLHNTP